MTWLRRFLGALAEPQRIPKCRHCRKPATWQSHVSGHWLCDTCRECWCHYCNGRVGVHGETATRLYRDECEAYERMYRKNDCNAKLAVAKYRDAYSRGKTE